MNIIIFGLPGAGKGTQAKMIAVNQNIPHIFTGDLLRNAYQEKSELGLLARNYMNQGKLVPDDVSVGVTLKRLEEHDCITGFLLDGFPRNKNQADALEQYLFSQSKKINHVIYIHVEETILQERLTGRRVCSRCGASFHIIHNPSKLNNQCDFCQELLMQREDDKEETVIERLRVNKELTNNLVEYYEKKGVLRVINGSQEIMKVTEEILNLLGTE